MAKVKKAYFCSSCGNESPKWMGKCPACGEWNTFVEEVIARGQESTPVAALTSEVARPTVVSQIEEVEHRRILLSSSEMNRVLGGGLVRGSLVLLGGEPGIGKSTLSLQVALQSKAVRTLYVSGEESPQQIKMRAVRLGGDNDECYIYAETLLDNIVAQVSQLKPDLLVIDSVQTIYTSSVESSAGSVSQIRECAAQLLRLAKTTSTS